MTRDLRSYSLCCRSQPSFSLRGTIRRLCLRRRTVRDQEPVSKQSLGNPSYTKVRPARF